MKNIFKKMKGKKVLSLILAAIMLATTFSVALPMVKTDAEAADITLGGISQTRVVSDYATKYAEYANRFFGGKGKSEATNFVIPGLSSSNDYTPQGMTYWKAKDWILISAYDATGEGKHSVIYALDGKTTKFVALFKVLNSNGSVNTSHGGGIAASEYNFYYADTDSKISYVPLSEMDVPVNTVKEIKLKGSIDCAGELGGAATSYCCYDEGVLWTGNFYFTGDDRYKTPAYSDFPSVLMGYKLAGNSSEEEWAYLNGKYQNLLEVNVPSGTGSANGSTLNWKAYKSGDMVDVVGTITAPSSPVGEYCPSYGYFNLVEGKKYIIQYETNVNPMLTDMYMFAPNGTHMDIKMSSNFKYTQIGTNKWHAYLEFTAGLKAPGADSSWPTTQSTSGAYTGTYSIRFDQDNIQTGEHREFAFTNVTVTEASDRMLDLSNETRVGYRGNNVGVVGNPTYCVLFSSSLDRVQYAMVDNGRIYISRSWSRSESTNHIRELVVGEIDLNAQGTIPYNINGRARYCQYVDESKMTKFGGTKDSSTKNQMFYMGEALCVIEGYLYMFAESAGWTYYGKESNKCPEGIDVIWKIDQFAIMGELRETESEQLSYYEKVTDVSQIKNTNNDLLNTDEYIIVYESDEKDPVTQKNILYALDAYGGHNGNKLPKNNFAMTENTNAYSVGIVGHPITEYSVDGNKLYLTNPEKDDVENIRWKFSGTNGSFGLHSTALYYAKYKHLRVNGTQMFMSSQESNQFLIDIYPEFNYEAYITADGYYLWANDGLSNYENSINNYYHTNSLGYTETPGTFHGDGLNSLAGINMRNVINGSVSDFGHGRFYIYKRVLDKNTETENSRVYTHSSAVLQPDGTYTIDLETYATASTQYTLLDEQRPTDFILVLDASGSMTNNEDAVGYHSNRNWDPLTMKQAAGDNDDIAENGNYNKEWTSNYYYKLPDGEFARISVAVNKGSDGTYSRDIWLWCKHPKTGRCYKLSQNGYLVVNNCTGNPSTDSSSRVSDEYFLANQSTLGYASASEILSEASSDKNRTDYHSSRNSKDKRRAYEVMNIIYDDGSGISRTTYYRAYGSCSRLCGMQQAVERLTYKIAEKSAETGFNHRIALVTYGSNASDSNSDAYKNTGMYVDGKWVQYSGSSSISTANYQKAFYDSNDLNDLTKLRRAVYGINTQSQDPDTYSQYGYEMANNIVANYSGGYLAEGDRSACIIMVTDGIPGLGDNDSESNKIAAANAAITQAYSAKQKGAYNFTVQMGDASSDWGSMTTYVDALSSEYIEAQSMTSLGDRNSNDIDYAMSIPTSSFDLNALADTVFNQVTANSRNALTQLSTSSILRQTLSDNFYAPVGSAKVQYLFADGYYDGLGRIAFENETDATKSGVSGKATTLTDAEGNAYYKYLDVSGYDYKTHYISKTHNGGKKLIIRITGVLPRATDVNTGAELNLANAAISDDSWTGIYQNNTKLQQKDEFKGFPNATFSVPKYTYVLDYGIQMYDVDVNGTLKSVSAELKAQRDANGNISYKSTSENGLVSITNNSQDLLYITTPTNFAESGYCLIQRDDGSYDWFEIEVVPASNVLYEETYMTNGASGATNWAKDGTTKTDYQSLTDAKTDVYGYDDVYADGTNSHSYGSADKATVSTGAKRSSTKTFNFIGEGIDLISACGKNTGIMIVKISGGGLAKAKSYIVDTYYDGNAADLICQTPIVSFKGDYGTYTVEATAAYLSTAGALQGKSTGKTSGGKLEGTKGVATDADIAAMLADIGMEDIADTDIELVWFDDNSILNGGTGAKGTTRRTRAGTTTTSLDCYLDGFRVYHPMRHANDNYVSSEVDAQYINVIDSLSKNQIGSGSTVIDKVAYVTGSLTDGSALSFANYQNVGPQNELYLANGKSDALVLQVSLPSPSSRVMLGLRAVTGTASVKIGGKQFDINSATEMYYDVTNCVSIENGVATITIQNNGSTLLAVNNIKLTGDATATLIEEEALEYASFAMAAPAENVNVVNGVVDPVTVKEPETPVPDSPVIPDDGDVTEPDNGDDTTGDNTTGSTSFIEQLIQMIIDLIMSLFNFLPIGEVM